MPILNKINVQASPSPLAGAPFLLRDKHIMGGTHARREIRGVVLCQIDCKNIPDNGCADIGKVERIPEIR